MAILLIFGYSSVPASAAETVENQAVIYRASGRVDYRIAAKSIIYLGNDFYLDNNEVISYDCTYTPKSASIDFGYIAPDGLFYSINCTSGSINKSIKVNQIGQYTLAIRNNASYAVTVTGTVRY